MAFWRPSPLSDTKRSGSEIIDSPLLSLIRSSLFIYLHYLLMPHSTYRFSLLFSSLSLRQNKNKKCNKHFLLHRYRQVEDRHHASMREAENLLHYFIYTSPGIPQCLAKRAENAHRNEWGEQRVASLRRAPPSDRYLPLDSIICRKLSPQKASPVKWPRVITPPSPSCYRHYGVTALTSYLLHGGSNRCHTEPVSGGVAHKVS